MKWLDVLAYSRKLQNILDDSYEEDPRASLTQAFQDASSRDDIREFEMKIITLVYIT